MNEVKKITIYIVEDYLLVRKSLRHVLSKLDKFEVLGDFDSAETFFTAFEKQQSDIVIMDLGLPGMNGLEATKIIKENYPEVKVAVLSSHEREEAVLATLASGANAYCLKDIEPDAWESLLLDVYKGVMWLHPNISYIANKISPKPISTDFDNLYPSKVDASDISLTEREKETLALVIDGKSNTEIAEVMNISPHTAKAHVGNLLTKLSVTDRVQAAVKAVKNGLLD